MPVNLSIKNAPDDVVHRLRERAAANHRSLQGELMSIIEMAAREPAPIDRAQALEVWRRGRAMNLPTDEGSAAIVRAMRDAR